MTLLVQLLLARTLGITSFGEYVYAFAWVQILGLVSRGGFDTAATRFVSVYNRSSDYGRLAGYLKATIAGCSGCVVVAEVLLLVLAFMLPGGNDSSMRMAMLAALVLLPVQTVSQMIDAMLRSAGASQRGLIGPLISNTVLIVVLLGFHLLGMERLTAANAVLLQSAASVPSLFLASYWLSRVMPKELCFSHGISERRAWAKAILPLFLFSLFVFAQGRLGTLFAGWFLGRESVAAYSVAERLALLTLFGLQSLNQIVAPDFAAMYNSKDMNALQRRVTSSARFGVLFAILQCAVMILFGRQILGLFGEAYRDAYTVLLVLTIGWAVNATTGPVNYLMNMTGRSWACVRIQATGAILTIILMISLVPHGGLVGIAMAVAFGTAFSNLVSVIYVRTRLGLWSVPFVPILSIQSRQRGVQWTQ